MRFATGIIFGSVERAGRHVAIKVAASTHLDKTPGNLPGKDFFGDFVTNSSRTLVDTETA